jgi:virginiamycin A acetyltransferase
VEPYSIVVGNPAKVIRKRFDNELIELMLKLKRWDLPIEEINKLIPLLHKNNLEYVKEKTKRNNRIKNNRVRPYVA